MTSLTAKLDAMSRFSRDCRDARVVVKPAIRLKMQQGVILVSRNIKETIRNPGGGFGPLIAGKANGLFATWSQEVYGDGLRAASFSPKLHSEIMNSGRKPGATQPPTEAIYNWLKDKRIRPRPISPASRSRQSPSDRQRAKLEQRSSALRQRAGLKRQASRKGSKKATAAQRKESDLRGLAFVIARSIKRKGIKGRFYVQKALQKSWPHLQTLFNGVAEIIVQPIVGRR